MAIRPMPRAEVEAAWREHFKATEAPSTESRNVGPVLYLTDPVRVPFRGHMYEVPPIPYTVGLRVVELQIELEAIGKQMDIEAYRRVLISVVKLVRQHARPTGFRMWNRLKWACGWNPFRQATEVELGEFLAVFVMRRTSRQGS
jgi:hypothetical protein